MDYFSIDGTANECFVLFHGTGGNEYSLLQIAGDIAPEASIISFLGNVGEGKARRFFAPLQNGQVDRADLDAQVEAFLAQWDTIKPTKRVTFFGFSNGANFILALLEKRPAIAERIVLLHPSNLHYTFAAGSEAQVIVTAGAMDPISIPGDTMKLTKQLQQHFPNVSLKLLDGQHGVTDAEIDYLIGALK